VLGVLASWQRRWFAPWDHFRNYGELFKAPIPSGFELPASGIDGAEANKGNILRNEDPLEGPVVRSNPGLPITPPFA